MRRVLLPVRASTEQTTTAAPPAAQAEDSVPSVDFAPSGAASTGYVEFDTGQLHGRTDSTSLLLALQPSARIRPFCIQVDGQEGACALISSHYAPTLCFVDTAGQTNMYPVLTKAYEVPAGGDTSSATSATNNTALIAGGLALTLVAIALGALTTGSGAWCSV